MIDFVPLVGLSPVVDEHVLPGFGTPASHRNDVPFGLDVRFCTHGLYQVAVSPRKVRAVRGYSLNITKRRKQVLKLRRIASAGVGDLHVRYGFENAGYGCVKFKPVTLRLLLSAWLVISPARIGFRAETRCVYGYSSFPFFSVKPTCWFSSFR